MKNLILSFFAFFYKPELENGPADFRLLQIEQYEKRVCLTLSEIEIEDDLLYKMSIREKLNRTGKWTYQEETD